MIYCGQNRDSVTVASREASKRPDNKIQACKFEKKMFHPSDIIMRIQNKIVDPDEVAHHLGLLCLQINHCILVDSSTVICWTSPFVLSGVSGVFCRLYTFSDGKSC